MRQTFTFLKSIVRRVRHDLVGNMIVILVLSASVVVVTAVAAVLNAVFNAPQPGLTDASRLVRIDHFESRSGRPDREALLSGDSFEAYAAREDIFVGVAASHKLGLPASVGPRLAAFAAQTRLVSMNYFQVLGTRPAAGRFFTEADKRMGPSAVLSFALTRKLGESPASIIGKQLTLNGVSATVIGVAERNFLGPHFDDPDELWLPLHDVRTVAPYLGENLANDFLSGNRPWLKLIARTRGHSVSDLTPRLPPNGSAVDGVQRRVVVRQLGNFLDIHDESQVRRVGSILVAFAVVVVLISVSNVVGTLTVRFSRLNNLFGTMIALGASRRRVFGVVAADCLFLAIASGLVAMLITPVLFAVLGELAGNTSARRLAELSSPFDGYVLCATLLFVLMLGLVCAFLSISRKQLISSSALMAQRTSAPVPARRQRWVLGLQIGLATWATTLYCLLSVGIETLSAQSARLESQDTSVLTVRTLTRGYNAKATSDLADALVAPSDGIVAAAVSMLPAHSSIVAAQRISVDGALQPAVVRSNLVSNGYFELLGPSVLAGRSFLPSDRLGAEPVAIVNSAFAIKYFGVPAATDRAIRIVGETKDRRIVGVTADAVEGPSMTASTPFMYFPLAQAPATSPLTLYGLTFYFRPLTETSLQAAIARLQRIDGQLRFEDHRTLTSQMQRAFQQQTNLIGMIQLVAVWAAGLGIGGLYGFLVYSTRLRRKELAVRVALGARGQDLARTLLRQLAWPVGAALATGLMAGIYSLPQFADAFPNIKMVDAAALATPVIWVSATVLTLVAIEIISCRRLVLLGLLKDEC